jgi:hypothetical protein
VFNSEIIEVLKLREATVSNRRFKSFVSEQMRRDMLNCRSPKVSKMTLTCLVVDSSTVLKKCQGEEIAEVPSYRSDVT